MLLCVCLFGGRSQAGDHLGSYAGIPVALFNLFYSGGRINICIPPLDQPPPTSPCTIGKVQTSLILEKWRGVCGRQAAITTSGDIMVYTKQWKQNSKVVYLYMCVCSPGMSGVFDS